MHGSPVTAPQPPMDTHRIHATLYRTLQPSLGSIELAGLLLEITLVLLLFTLFLRCVPVYLPTALRMYSGPLLVTAGYLEDAAGSLQVCACVCQPHGRGFLARRTSCEGSCDRCGESSRFRYSCSQVRNSNFSMECSDSSNSHPAASNGQCTQIIVRSAAMSSSPSTDHTSAFYLILVSCLEYLCQDTLVCVAKPIDCPCPNVQDIKCVVPDEQDAGSGTRFCIHGGTDCLQLEKLVEKFSP
jgi:hypothetical protein